MTVEAIKEAIGRLPQKDRSSLAAWIIEQDYDEWDKQMMKDFSPEGRGYRLVEEIGSEIRERDFAPFDAGSHGRRKQP